MLVVRSDLHRSHHVSELDEGRLIDSWESPTRADRIVAALDRHGFDQTIGPDPLDDGELAQVHDADYLTFLDTAWDRWVAAGRTGPAAMGFGFPPRRSNPRRPDDLDGQLGYYSFAVDCSIGPTTATVARESAALAQTAARRVIEGERAAFALCRPPGHHAGRDQFGGYCYLNNAAAAAQHLRNHGAGRVGILDIDYHHGNGTQDIFYERADVVVASLHCDPRHQFPYFTGHADETGRGAGAGANRNYPLAPGTGAGTWLDTMTRAGAELLATGIDALVVSLGLDTYVGDPISDFTLDTTDYPIVGATLARLDRPTVLVLEGGYATDVLGDNVVAVLQGFETPGVWAP